jgi:hypothetical protein
MTAASPLVFPGSRTLAEWWRQLAAWQPRALWVGRLLVHRLEAAVQLSHPCRLDRFTLLVLRAVALAETRRVDVAAESPDSLALLDEHLRLGRSWLTGLLGKLQTGGLVCRNGSGAPQLTPLGRQALHDGEYPKPDAERRVFYFREHDGAGRGPHFLDLQRPPPAASPPPAGWQFDIRELQACVARPAEWKERFGFPRDVRAVLGADAASAPGDTPFAWRHVIVDQAGLLPVALALAPVSSGAGRLVAFGASRDSWALQADRPVLTLNTGWHEPFPELAADPPLEHWRDAWLAWCQPRGLPAAEVTGCSLERRDHRLRVLAPRRLVEQLRQSHADVFRARSWVLAGEGALRAAGLLEVAPRESEQRVPASGR